MKDGLWSQAPLPHGHTKLGLVALVLIAAVMTAAAQWASQMQPEVYSPRTLVISDRL